MSDVSPRHATPLATRALRSVVEEWGWTAGNEGENLVISALHEAGVAPSEVEQQFHLGRWRLDFAWPRYRIAIEADGWVHTAESTKQADRVRDRQLAEWLWEIRRINVDEDEVVLRRQVASVVELVRWEQRHGR